MVDLAAAMWGYEKSEMAIAAANLLHEFGHEIPARPDSWFAKQERQKPIRNAIESVRVEHIRRRAFRVWCEPLLQGIDDPDERREDAQTLWEAMEPVAMKLYEGMHR